MITAKRAFIVVKIITVKSSSSFWFVSHLTQFQYYHCWKGANVEENMPLHFKDWYASKPGCFTSFCAENDALYDQIKVIRFFDGTEWCLMCYLLYQRQKTLHLTVAATCIMEYHSNDTAYRESDRLRRWRDKVGEVRSQQSWSFLGGVRPVQEQPRNNGWLVHFSTCCSLWLYKNTQRRCLLWVKHSKSFPPCLFILGQGNTLNPLRVRWGWLACSAYLKYSSR